MRACVLLADGFEEIEAITVIDVLRRAGIEVSAVGVHAPWVQGAHGVVVQADHVLGGDGLWDAVILPGGLPGATTLRDSEKVRELVLAQSAAGRVIAAICAAPIVLGAAGVLEGRDATCYPGFEEELTGANRREEAVVEDGHVITARGPGTAMDFAMALVSRLVGRGKADELRAGMLVSG